LTLLEGFLGSIVILSKVRAQRLVLTGSYLGLAPALAAISLRIPYFLLEFNRIAGRVNRYLAPYAYEVELGVPLAYPIRGRSILTGVPLRPELSSLKRKDDGRTVIFLGGSQGASVLNWASLEVARARPELRFLVLAGDRDYPALIRAQRPQNLQIFPFLPDPTPLYQLASLAVSRAGGIAIAELASSGIPMILVPFPYASDDHQTANARWIERKGAGVMLEQGRLKELAKLVGELIGDSQRLKEMSARACVIFDRNGARLIAERVLKC
jgi:UDP-N-acetylglucosamine--N-acetylmuramyl-(pentapeptide) pyrophosphoryl-undecaprenol N-acetylglucosamine transferase